MGVRDRMPRIFSSSSETILKTSVLMLPGPMPLTRMPWLARDRAMLRVRLFTPPLAALYGAMPGMAVTPLTEDMLMMTPPRPGDALFCATICRADAWPVRKTPVRFTRMTASQSDSERSRKSATRRMPALDTQMSRPPKASTVSATAPSTSTLDPTSHGRKRAWMPWSRARSSAAWRPAAASTSSSITLAPLIPRDFAHARPIPRAAPVTMATLP
mmetsp:Transcript_15858/g.40431  ORF Transcript_15858/g.40431 Transcript_15858/m.40431 type:complete len:215 (-) Transcript_15858:102-746(-)